MLVDEGVCIGILVYGFIELYSDSLGGCIAGSIGDKRHVP